MCWDDYDSSPDPAYAWVKARKEHRCCACAETIRPGDKYHRTFQVNDRSPDVFKHCPRCWAIVEAIWDQGEPCQWDLHCGEAWEDTIGEVPEKVAWLAFITPDEAQKEFAP